jgi:hypothetical protein
MATFEEQIVKSYYNLKNYFTLENIPFSAAEKRKGGKGRGEIDLIAIKIGRNNGKVEEAIHVEVSASIKSKFPFKSEKQSYDEVHKLLKKFFISDVDDKLKEFYAGNYKFQFITSIFNDDIENRLKDRLKHWGADVQSIKREKQKEGESLLVNLRYNGKLKEIKITPFTDVLKELVTLTKNRTEYFSISTVRAMQWLNKLYVSKNL